MYYASFLKVPQQEQKKESEILQLTLNSIPEKNISDANYQLVWFLL